MKPINTTRILERLASVELTLFGLGLMMIVVLFGTLAQVNLGTFEAQKIFFNRFFVWADFGGMKIPVFPGGLTVGAIWYINLSAALIVRFRYRWAHLGILLSHLGLMLLLIGQFLTQQMAKESQMSLEIGETKRYSENIRDAEIVLIDASDPAEDTVISIPHSLFSRKRQFEIPGTALAMTLRAFYPNAELGRGNAAGAPLSLATQGIGPQISVHPLPVTSKDDEANNATVFAEFLEGGKSLGVWLLSMSLAASQTVSAGGKTYQIALRPRRHYYPFSLTLKEFRHDRYAGTDIPKNFSSLVHLVHPEKGENRDALIYMNHPLRYEGLTFYQASFGKGDTLSILQVVRNPVWLTPYIACTIVILGLLVQFLGHFREFIRRKRA